MNHINYPKLPKFDYDLAVRKVLGGKSAPVDKVDALVDLTLNHTLGYDVPWSVREGLKYEHKKMLHNRNAKGFISTLFPTACRGMAIYWTKAEMAAILPEEQSSKFIETYEHILETL